MNYVLDLAVILIVLGTVLTYYKKGFVRAVLGFGKVILAALISALFGKGLGVIIDGRYMNARVTDSVFGSISKMYDAGSSVFDLSKLAEKIPSSLATLAERCGVDLGALASQYAGDTAATGERLREVAAAIAAPISALISKILGYVLVFAAAYLVLLIAGFIIEKVAELPVIRSVNKLLGLLLGLVCAVVYTFLFVLVTNAVIYFVVASGDQSATLDVINKTFIFKFIAALL
ncbi:MAG TPA: hypothetical protein GX011_04420 [Clostridiales bacterium]|jgi:uncharacterized membrane protein required for colicin V production|nr:hypothetical protein [Clostridiales bacterium]